MKKNNWHLCISLALWKIVIQINRVILYHAYCAYSLAPDNEICKTSLRMVQKSSSFESVWRNWRFLFRMISFITVFVHLILNQEVVVYYTNILTRV